MSHKDTKDEIINEDISHMTGLGQSEKLVVQKAEEYSAEDENLWAEIASETPTRQDDAIESLLSAVTSTPVTLEATWDFSLHGTAASVQLGASIPDQALLTRAFMDVLTPLVGATDIAFTVGGNALGNTAGGSTGPAEGDLDGTAANMIKTTQADPVVATLTGTPSAGKVRIYYTYVK
jgi:hypothetical protein